MNLFYRELGDPAAPPIIILHGLFGSSDNWLTISKIIAVEGYRVILPDQRNHGQSPRNEAFTYAGMAADLHDLITTLGLENPVLVGHSMGGKTVMQYAISYPNKFRKLVVVDIAPRFYPVHHTGVLRGLAAIDLAKITTRNEAEAVLSVYEPLASVRQFLLKNLYRPAPGPGTLPFAWRLNLPVISREIDGIGAALASPRPVLAPTLFIRGEQSEYIRDEDWAGIEQLFPHAELATISGAGHWVQAEKPTEFVAVLLRFLVQP